MFGTKPAVGGVPSYLLDLYPGAALAYSTIKLSSVSSLALRGSSAALTEEDITLASDVINATQLQTLAGGGLATAAKWIDQSGGSFGDLEQTTKTIQPNITNNSGISLGYLDTTNDYTTGSKYYLTSKTPRPATNADYIVSIVFKNNVSSSTDSVVFGVMNSSTDGFSFNIRRSGSNYLIDFIRNATLNPSIRWTITHSLSDWVLLTFTVIGGTVSMYANGTLITSSGAGFSVDNRTTGVAVACRPIAPTTQPRQLHIKTILMYSDADLSAFNLTGFNNEMKTLHGIS